MPVEHLVLLALAFFLVATLYASVGFGGGSSYLALLALVIGSFFMVRSLALVCNLVVVSGSSYLYFKNGHINIRTALPFVLMSIPMAFIGARFRLEAAVYFSILGISLISSSIFLLAQTFSAGTLDLRERDYPRFFNYILGGAIGLLSGVVGIGGGIFLAPILHHLQWGRPIKIAALASLFILVNSIAGLVGIVSANAFELPVVATPILVVVVFLGGQLGLRLSLGRITPDNIKRLTALLVFVVGLRVLLVNGLGLF